MNYTIYLISFDTKPIVIWWWCNFQRKYLVAKELYFLKITVFSLCCFSYTPVFQAIFEHDRAVYHAQKGNYATALPLLQKAVIHKPNDAVVLYDAGVAAYKAKDTDQAYAYFSAVTQLPNIPKQLLEQAHYNRAIIHVDRKEYEQALEQCNRVLQINPDNSKAKELKTALEKEKKQKQKEESEDHNKNSDKQKNGQENKKDGQKNRNDKKDEEQNQPQEADGQDKQTDMGKQVEHKKHQDKKENNKQQSEKKDTPSTSKENVPEKLEKNKMDNKASSPTPKGSNAKPQLDPMLERALEDQEQSSKANLKTFLKAASQGRRVGSNDQNNW